MRRPFFILTEISVSIALYLYYFLMMPLLKSVQFWLVACYGEPSKVLEWDRADRQKRPSLKNSSEVAFL